MSRFQRPIMLAILVLTGIALSEIAFSVWSGRALTNFPRHLVMPVRGASISNMRDTFDETRGTNRKHEATDILAPRGTPVVAADDGVIKKLFLSKPGGLTIYQFDPTEQYAYYYAHLDRYAEGIHEGTKVHRGDVIAYVGSTGNASPNEPHLHFGIFVLGPEKRWWEGTPINPYPILMSSENVKL